MKKSTKILSLALCLSLAIGATAGMTAVASAETAAPDAASASPQASVASIAETRATAAQVYLVPGEGNSLAGTKLTADELSALHMSGDVYKAGAAGSALPTPTTTKTDSKNAPFVFNGWWYIKDATVTYVDVVPAEEEITYLYADFRAALSQHQAPVAPAGGGETAAPSDYMLVTRAETGEQEIIPLRVSGTDVKVAEQGGHGGPVQWYNEWFVLEPGDTVSFWFSGVYGAQTTYGPKPRHSPQSCDILMENSGKYGTTGRYLRYVNDDYAAGTGTQLSYSGKFFNANAANEVPTLAYTGMDATQAYVFRTYIKLYDEGGHMTLFMENLSLKLGVKA